MLCLLYENDGSAGQDFFFSTEMQIFGCHYASSDSIDFVCIKEQEAASANFVLLVFDHQFLCFVNIFSEKWEKSLQ